MEALNVVAAGVAGFVVGAVWYTLMAKRWQIAAGIPDGPDGKPVASAGPTAFAVGLAAMILAAGMMRHIFAASGVTGPGEGLVAGAGIGAFLVLPWLAMNYGFAMRSRALTLIDGVNAVAASAAMGLVLTVF